MSLVCPRRLLFRMPPATPRAPCLHSQTPNAMLVPGDQWGHHCPCRPAPLFPPQSWLSKSPCSRSTQTRWAASHDQAWFSFCGVEGLWWAPPEGMYCLHCVLDYPLLHGVALVPKDLMEPEPSIKHQTTHPPLLQQRVVVPRQTHVVVPDMIPPIVEGRVSFSQAERANVKHLLIP